MRSDVAPLAPGRVGFQFSADQRVEEKLRYARALLGHEAPAAEIPEVIERALDALIEKLEKRKFAATSRPRSGRPHASTNPRHIPAEVKHTVWARDGGQCTFVSESGRRCPARSRLEFDHIQAVARGGETAVGNLRLLCRAHNQYEAERTFGAGFMSEKREAARRAAEARRGETSARGTETEWSATEAKWQDDASQAAPAAHGSAEAQSPKLPSELAEAAPGTAETRRQELPSELAEAARRAEEAWRQELAARAEEEARRKAQEARVKAAVEEIVTPLRILGCRKEEARRIAATCAPLADAPIEERLRFAIRQLGPRGHRVA